MSVTTKAKILKRIPAFIKMSSLSERKRLAIDFIAESGLSFMEDILVSRTFIITGNYKRSLSAMQYLTGTYDYCVSDPLNYNRNGMIGNRLFQKGR